MGLQHPALRSNQLHGLQHASCWCRPAHLTLWGVQIPRSQLQEGCQRGWSMQRPPACRALARSPAR